MRRSIFIHACGAGIAFLCAVLSVFSFFIDPTGNPREIVILLSILGCMTVYYSVAIGGVVRGHMPASLRSVLVWAVVFRVLLLPSQPILETDYYRYLWDGYVLSQGLNPCQFSPDEILSSGPVDGLSTEQAQALERLRGLAQRNGRAQSILSEVNNPSVITIYPPFAQVMFGVSAAFFPLSIYGWRVLILFFDASLILSLVVLLPRFGRDPRWVLIYAWSPLVLKETVNTLHFDAIATSALFLAILFSLAGFGKRSAAAWACGTLTKLYPALAIPIWSKKWDWRSWLTFVMIVAGLVFLFSGAGWRGASGWAAFAHRWESNSSVVVVLETLLGWIGVPPWGSGFVLCTLAGILYRLDAFLLSKIVCALTALTLAAVLAWKSLRQDITDEQRLRWTFWLVGTTLLCSPVCNPWYITWVVPFLCFYPRLSWLYLSAACFIHYTFFIPDPWGYLPGARVLEYAPFFLLLGWEWKAGFQFGNKSYD